MKTMLILLLGAIGGVLLYFLESAIHLSSGFPLATLIINLVGSFALGFLRLGCEKRVRRMVPSRHWSNWGIHDFCNDVS